ncbi:MAG: transposase [Nitrososphaerota archaeon]|jgi:transposase|nr:transposase [Nitrososphaerota archaeon]
MDELNQTNQRIHEGIKDVRFKRQSIVSTIRLNGEKVAFVFEGTLNKELFAEYLKICLAPTLGAKDVLVLDNSSGHTSKLVRDVLGEFGVKVMFLPVYSPDFNPVELLWAYVKSVLRKLKARSEEALLDAVVVALDCVTPELVAGWFRHCNYAPPIQLTKS